ncbi:serine carboxypeptidase [Phaffia rhodozyma]|uniref:Carboxypeptidase n=1 Tax=Phaffia rhodozyma TaxID=264483 RepID=A0A0F7SKW2_PHARH|nr:serine carboxypeptidase [Phaffia rhodozyma]
MKASGLLAFTFPLVALAAPFLDPSQLAFNIPSVVQQVLAYGKDQIGNHLEGPIYKAQDFSLDSWGLVKGWVEQEGKMFETLTHPSLPEYKLRVTEPKLCDSSVKQYSGYLDIGTDKHLWFWFFESRNKPKKDPLVLWLNGHGPGCSSSTGLLFELGPCSIQKNGTITNPYSWTESANVLFLDQPINVGFSYSDRDKVSTSPAAAEDVFAFLTMFIARYQDYKDLDFHISGESYAGTYLPNIASVIHRNAKALRSLGAEAPLPALKFTSILIGNGLTDPLVQMGTGVYDYACESKYAVFDKDSQQCRSIAAKAPTCAKLIQSCYNTNSRFTCVPAGLYCWSSLYADFQKLGLNPYDVRKTCDKSPEKDGPLCYPQMGWVETYLNEAEIKRQLGVPKDLEFKSCNMQVNQAFMSQGDGMHNSAALLPELLEDGIRLLIYAGETDFIYIGNLQWLEALDSPFKVEFNQAKLSPYVVIGGKKKMGSVKVAGAQGFTAGNLAFVSIEQAGHMVPFDQPEVALDLFSRWLHNVPLVLSKPE